jgi:hypothetical protein
MRRKVNRQKGYSTLISVIIVSAITFSFALSLLTISTANNKLMITIERSQLAKALANTCAEQALFAIRKDTNFSGDGGLVMGQGSCTYSVIKIIGEEREILASGTVATVTRKLKISVTKINPVIQVSSWQEVADFTN